MLFGSDKEPALWELFSENSKLARWYETVSDAEERARLVSLYESLPYTALPVIALPRRLPVLDTPLSKAIESRASFREMRGETIALGHLSAILQSGYGVSDRTDTREKCERKLRVVPSAGALYPLELYVHVKRVHNLAQGLYHYHPPAHNLRLLRMGDFSREISEALIQETIPSAASFIILITAMFERSVFKYGDRGYRYIMLEAGHVAQNINLASEALGLGALNIGGFFDSDIDRLLGLDGSLHSSVYLIAVGGRGKSKAKHSRVKPKIRRTHVWVP